MITREVIETELNVMKIVTVNADATIHVGILKGMTGCVTSYDADTGMPKSNWIHLQRL